jgi:hypothetical protein
MPFFMTGAVACGNWAGLDASWCAVRGAWCWCLVRLLRGSGSRVESRPTTSTQEVEMRSVRHGSTAYHMSPHVQSPVAHREAHMAHRLGSSHFIIALVHARHAYPVCVSVRVSRPSL